MDDLRHPPYLVSLLGAFDRFVLRVDPYNEINLLVGQKLAYEVDWSIQLPFIPGPKEWLPGIFHCSGTELGFDVEVYAPDCFRPCDLVDGDMESYRLYLSLQERQRQALLDSGYAELTR